MSLTAILFWTFWGIVFFAYAGYAIVVYGLLRLGFRFQSKVNKDLKDAHEPVTLIIPAYNEAPLIERKIQNCLALDYPKHLLSIVFVTDGSTDGTPDEVSKYKEVGLLHATARKGKIDAMNRVMKTVTTPFVVFCDANTLLNEKAVQEIMKHYRYADVGGVSGEKKVLSLNENNAAGQGEGFYWKYESKLKQLDSDFYSVVGAAGELFSFRTALYEEVEPDTLLDDFMISLRICKKGYRIIYEPAAYALEQPSFDLKEERKRKIRISTGGFQSISRLTTLLRFFEHPRLSFLYFSHRVLRWAVCPFLLPIIFFLNAYLAFSTDSALYTWLLVAQIVFYGAAVAGWLLNKIKKPQKALTAVYYFVFMNISLYQGFVRFLRGNYSAAWEKAQRAG